MKTRYKIIIVIVCLSFIPFSMIFPDVFLIFHLDKYETNEICDSIGEWNWFSDTCKIDYNLRDKIECEDIGAKTICQPCHESEGYSPWPRIMPYGCLDMCRGVCDFSDLMMDKTNQEWTTTYTPYPIPDGQIKAIIGNCNCQADPESRCPEPFLRWKNSTHYIDNIFCEWKDLPLKINVTRGPTVVELNDTFYPMPEPVPEPPITHYPSNYDCGPGATYHQGVCMVD